jgi:hypothetical protein
MSARVQSALQAAVVAFAAVSAVLTVYLVLLVLALLRPSLHFSQSAYVPERGVLCPGEALVFTTTVHVERTPALPTIVQTWWDREAARTVVRDPAPEVAIWTADTPAVITTPNRVIVPALPPGAYELRVGVRTSDIAVYSVPFSVPEGC